MFLDRVGKSHQPLQIGARHFRGHAPAFAREEQRHQVENGELRREALRGRDRELRSRSRDQCRAGFAHNRSVRNVRDGNGLHAARQGLALRRDRVGSLARLRDDHDDRVHRGVRRAITILAGILHIDGDAGKILDHDFARQARVPARTAGGDDQLLEGEQRAFDGIKFAGEDDVVLQVLRDGFRNGCGLLVDLPAHGVGVFLVAGGLRDF